MILLKEIQLNNFLSHSNTTLKFKKGQKVLLSGVSGSGKSSIVEALIWALYGKGRSDNKSLIKRGAKDTKVVIILSDEKVEYKIERSITEKNKHEFKILENKNKKFVPIKTVGIKGAQEYLEDKILRSSYLLFINSIVFPQSNIESFVRQTASKRKDILLEIIKASDYNIPLKKAKELLSKNNTESEVLESKILDKKTEVVNNEGEAKKLNQYKKEQKEIQKNVDETNTKYEEALDLRKEIDEEKIKINNKKDEIKRITETINENSEKITKLLEKKKELDSIDLNLLLEKVEELGIKRGELEVLEQKREKNMVWQTKMNDLMASLPPTNNYQEQIDETNRQIIAKMEEEIPGCPKCAYINPVLEENKQRGINTLEEQLEATEGRLSASKADIETYESNVAALGLAPEKIEPEAVKKLKDEISELEWYERKLTEANNLIATKEEIDEEINALGKTQEELNIKIINLEEDIFDTTGEKEEQLEDLFSELSAKKQEFNQQQIENAAKLAVAEQSYEIVEKNKELVDKFTKENIRIKDEIESLEMVKGAFGPNGIKSIVIDYLVPQLEEKINEVLEKLSDFRIKLETQKSGLGQSVLLEGLFITVVNGQAEELDIENLSGGEFLRVSVAISEGLASVSKCGFRVLDEAIVGLDEETIDGFVEVMMKLKDDVNQLVCISHIQQVKDIFQEQIKITKINGNSKII